LASLALIELILPLIIFDLLESTLPETLFTTAETLASLAFAALSCLLRAAFLAFGALRSYFLRAATLF
jgi:hypothetical protein